MAAEPCAAKPGNQTVTNAKTESPPRLIPNFLFHTETVTDKDSNSFQTMELVRKNQPLVQLTPPPAGTPLPKPSELVAGKHTLLSDDKNSLLAEINGYPLLSKKTSKGTDLIMISLVPLVSISEDKMQATVSLYPPVSNCLELTSKHLFDILTSDGVHFGMTQEHLNELLTRCKEERSLLINKTVARGLLPLTGKDSFLRFDIEVGPLPGKLLGNGKIDFRERKMFVGITKGQTIATQVPPTDGTSGINVLGDKVPQLPGRSLPVTVSGDAEYDKKSGVIRATRSGILSLVNKNSIKVCAKQVISGNIDYNTGNIESQDAVEISGTILPGFKVKTKGDLLLGGNARSAIIKCKGNLVVKGGILGEKCKVKVEGDTDLSFMEQGYLRVKGNVIIRKQAYYTKIMADGEILCKEDSQIMAGFLMSAASLNLGNVGSANSPHALLAAGIAPGRYLRYLKMRSQLRDIEQERLIFLQRHGLKQKIKQRESLEEAICSLHQDIARLNLIPGTDANTADSGAEYLKTITITVQGTIFSGTELQIGNTTTTTERDLRGVRFSLDRHCSTFIKTKL
jgi:uncharacterized protein (DUF342 family)